MAFADLLALVGWFWWLCLFICLGGRFGRLLLVGFLIDRLFCFGFMVIGYMLWFDSVWMVVVVYLSVVWLVLMICLGVGCLLLLLVIYC